VQKHAKAPDTKMSWKATQAQLTYPEADERIAHGYNVGVSGRSNDKLILVDIDDPAIEHELKPTLKIRSRSRTGTHAIYWAHPDDNKLPCNIPTEQGEIRSSDQYVVAPGSYVPCRRLELLEKYNEGEINQQQYKTVLKDDDRGLYTVENHTTPEHIRFDELPTVFKETYQTQQEKQEQYQEQAIEFDPDTIEGNGNRSALFDLEISHVAPSGLGEREPHPLHDSGTGMNWLVDGDLGHCWRHLVSLNALQYLCVQAGYLNCQEAGSPHHNSSHGPSMVLGDNRAVWEAWKEAKSRGYIPEDDPVPVRALHFIADKHELCPSKLIPSPSSDELMPYPAYKRAIEIVESRY